MKVIRFADVLAAISCQLRTSCSACRAISGTACHGAAGASCRLDGDVTEINRMLTSFIQKLRAHQS